MKIFIGSSEESKSFVDEIACEIENLSDSDKQGYQPQKWYDNDVFVAGDYTLDKLIQTARTVDAAVLVFNFEDKTTLRNKAQMAVRDNVLLEYGVFSGIHTYKNVCIVCINRTDEAHFPTDIVGITFIDYQENKKNNFRKELSSWLKQIEPICASSITKNPIAAFLDKTLANSEGLYNWRVSNDPNHRNLGQLIKIGTYHCYYIPRTEKEIGILGSVKHGTLIFTENDDICKIEMTIDATMDNNPSKYTGFAVSLLPNGAGNSGCCQFFFKSLNHEAELPSMLIRWSAVDTKSVRVGLVIALHFPYGTPVMHRMIFTENEISEEHRNKLFSNLKLNRGFLLIDESGLDAVFAKIIDYVYKQYGDSAKTIYAQRYEDWKAHFQDCEKYGTALCIPIEKIKASVHILNLAVASPKTNQNAKKLKEAHILALFKEASFGVTHNKIYQETDDDVLDLVKIVDLLD